MADDDTTPFTCLACGGEYEKLYDVSGPALPNGQHRKAMVRCEFCTCGAMSESDHARWKVHLELTAPKRLPSQPGMPAVRPPKKD